MSREIDVREFLITEKPSTSKQVLVIRKELKESINQIIHEYRQQSKLKSHGLSNRRKILLTGSPGTGKTLTAKVLAYELKMPLHSVQLDRIVSRYMGETGTKLRQVFDFMQDNLGVYLFDEFDSIGTKRSLDGEVGEIRRVLNSFLQFIERDTSSSILVAATNNKELLDGALFRRFDDVLKYEDPTDEEKQQLISNKLGSFKPADFNWELVLERSNELSHSEIVQACLDAIKKAILADKKKVSSDDLYKAIDQRFELPYIPKPMFSPKDPADELIEFVSAKIKEVFKR